ncbi:MAG TPA: efflux RND transporter periplasmic adaptor subunit [Bacteroidales bacterium]|nr:efflux RND transporter periplasmic adaptor subunit [Bacteroidales bacterium]HRZ48880.1 efflux RND transporter periplasmic adaptor subunit [Bacteroidales bacterium]
MKKRTVYVLVAAAVVILILLVVAKKQGWIAKDKSVKVSTEKAEKRSIIEIVSASGKIQPEVELLITPDVSGEIVELYVKEGDKVKKGQMLARINPENYLSFLEQMEAGVNTQRANLANARTRQVQMEAQLLKSKSEYNRINTLHKKGAVSEAEFEAASVALDIATAELEAAKQSIEAARFGVKSAEASLREARVNLTKTTLFAPMDGTVSRLSKKKGERVVGTSQFEGTEIMRIADLSNMEVSIEVSENDIIRVKLNDTAEVEVDAYPDRKFSGVVTRIANSASSTQLNTDQVTNFEVKIRLLQASYTDLVSDDPGQSPFRPGMSASVDIRTAYADNVLTIPIESVTARADTSGSKIAALKKNFKDQPAEEQSEEEKQRQKKAELKELKQYVFVYEAGTVKMREVETGIQDSEYIRVVSGLKEGEEIVVAPYSAVTKDLKNGDKVKKVSKNELFRDKE